MRPPRLHRLNRDKRVERIRQLEDGVSVLLSAKGRAELLVDPEGLISDLHLEESAARLETDLPAALIERFAPPLWPRWIHFQKTDGQANLVGQLQKDLHWLQGHFPGDPILPGVIQLHWAVELGRFLFRIPDTFQGVDALKFQHILVPGGYFSLDLDHDPDRHRLRFAFRHGGGHYSQGRVRFHPGPA